MQQSILIILHQEHSTPGRVGNALRQLGYALDIRRPRFGDPLPQTMADHAAGIIFGGPMSANDRTISFGARSIGSPCRCGRTSPSSASASARRCSPATSAAKCSAIRKAMPKLAITRSGRPRPALPWSSDGRNASTNGTAKGFDLPPDAELLAAGDTFEVQAIRSKSRLWPAIPPRRHPRHDAQMDNARTRSHATSGRAAPRYPFRRPGCIRLHGARVAQRFPGTLDVCGLIASRLFSTLDNAA